MTKKKLIVMAIILGIIGAIAVFEFRDSTQKFDTLNSQLVDINNQAVDFDAFTGKIVFVNNWASWCPPCIAEMPSIHKLKNQLQNTDVIFVMVSFDEDRNKARTFMKKRGFDFEVYFPGHGYPYATPSIPATYLLDKEGNVAEEFTGMTDFGKDEMVNKIKALAK
jgi:thiol-disulfide isomerase/thioredoxin